MRYWITRKPEVALMLIPWFVPFYQTREEMYLDLREQLTNTPENTFVCVVIEDDQIKGMTVAYTREDDVFISHASSDRHLPRHVVDDLLGGIKHWAKGKGYHTVSGLPNRAKRIWKRRWGFKESTKNEHEVCMEI